MLGELIAYSIQKYAEELVVRCDSKSCNKLVHLCDLRSHLESNCTQNATIKDSLTVDMFLHQASFDFLALQLGLILCRCYSQ